MERKPFNRNILTNFFEEPTLQKHFVKIINMAVDGHIINYIQKNLREVIRKRIVEGMGYIYKAPELNRNSRMITYELDISQV